MLTLPRGAPTTPLYVYLAYHAGPRSVNHFYCTAPLFMHPSFFISADVFPQKVLTAGPSYANISPALSVFCVPPICASGGIGRLARFRSSVHYARAGSSPASRTKKKDTTFVVSFFLGAAPFGISMLCRSKPSLRNCLVLRTCEFTAHQRRRSEDRSDISIAQILTVPSTSEQVLYRLLRLIL